MNLYLQLVRKEYKITGINDLDPVIDELTTYLTEYRLFLLSGNLGAGKTTLVSRWMKKLGCKDLVSSPTFSVINEYVLPDSKVYHMDFYRIEDISEVYDIGIDEYLLEEDSICIIEWPEIFRPEIKDDFVSVRIEQDGDCRLLSLQEVVSD